MRASGRACLAAGLLAACASSQEPSIAWYKPGSDDVELDRALAACQAVSGVSVDEVDFADPVASELRRAFTMCMRERGWVWGVSEP